MSNANAPAIKRMADFLRLGAKMLNINCPECNNPLFQLENSEFFCPSCQKRIVLEKRAEKDKLPAPSDAENMKKAPALAKKMRAKLLELSDKLTNETNIQVVKDILKSIWLILKILVDLEKFQGI